MNPMSSVWKDGTYSEMTHSNGTCGTVRIQKKCGLKSITIVRRSECFEQNFVTLIFLVMAVACIFIAATLVAYLVPKSFKTVAEKCEFMFLLGLLLFYIAYPLFDNQMLRQPEIIFETMLIALGMVFFWITVLTFDIWLTLR